jgi:hypothetical protein
MTDSGVRFNRRQGVPERLMSRNGSERPGESAIPSAQSLLAGGKVLGSGDGAPPTGVW